MGSQDKFYSVSASDKGTDDIGIAQASGTVSAVASANAVAGRSDWKTKLLLTVNATTAMKDGMPIRIAALDAGHSGLTRILKVVSTTQIIVDITYNASLVDGTGTWALDGGKGAWDAFIPMGADLTAANLTITFHDSKRQGGSQVLVNYTKDVVYRFPGVINTIQISTAGNVKLIRAASLRPFGKSAT